MAPATYRGCWRRILSGPPLAARPSGRFAPSPDRHELSRSRLVPRTVPPGPQAFPNCDLGGAFSLGLLRPREMPVRRRVWLVFLGLSSLGCANTPNNVRPLVDASHPVDCGVDRLASACQTDPVLHDASGPRCKWSAALDDNCVLGCKPTRAYVTCTESGGSASYPASDPMGCISCSGTCQDFCAPTEFALACNVPQPDAAASAGPTQGCHAAFTLPLGGEVYCCPCQ